MRVLINGPVLHHGFRTSLDVEEVVQAVVQKVNLQVKAPPGHVFIKIVEVRIMIHIFKLGYPAVMLAQHFRERSFSGADISCYCNMFGFLSFRHYDCVQNLKCGIADKSACSR